jgi:hypothetical protein
MAARASAAAMTVSAAERGRLSDDAGTSRVAIDERSMVLSLLLLIFWDALVGAW